MASTRFKDVIGFGVSEEDPPESGIWVKKVTERVYFGDIIRNSRRLENDQKVNNDLTVGNSISIVADPYAHEHFFAMLYIKWGGVLWEIENIDVQSPRLILRLGGVYNGDTPTVPVTP